MRVEDIKALLKKYDFSDTGAFEDWLREAQETYRLVYLLQAEKHNFDTARTRLEDETQAAHTARLKALDNAIKRDVVDVVNHVLEPEDFKKVKAALDPLAIEYLVNEVRHKWQGCQEFGGTVQIGYMTRLDALEYLNKAVREVNVIYIDDYHHFIFFRTPSIQPSK